MTASHNEHQYLDSINHLYRKSHQVSRADRTGTGTYSEFGVKMVFDISKGRVPLLSTKFVPMKAIAHELIWMLSGSDRIAYLKQNNVNIWDEWLMDGSEVYDDSGKLVDGISSSIYGESWRRWSDIVEIPVELLQEHLYLGYELISLENGIAVTKRYVDQIDTIRHQLRTNPTSRRIILNGWNAARVDHVKLPPCHTLAQFYVEQNADGQLELSCQVYLRSNDAFLGAPFNMVQYALLTHLLANEFGFATNKLHYAVGDYHLYENHVTQAAELLSREPLEENDPYIKLAPGTTVDNFTIDKMELVGYHHLPAIKAPIAV